MKRIIKLFLILLFLIPTPILAEGNPYYGGWSNCTWSAWQLAYEATGMSLPSLGNAGQWYGNAAAYGYTVSTTPRANSIGVWSGHVVYVADCDGQNIYIKEGGFLGGYHEGWADGYSSRYGQALLGYIYLDGNGGGEYVAPTTTNSSNNKVAAPTPTPVVYAIASDIDVENLDADIIKQYEPELVETVKESEKDKSGPAKESDTATLIKSTIKVIRE